MFIRINADLQQPLALRLSMTSRPVDTHAHVFTRALPMSGTFNLMRFTEATHPTDYYRVSSPLHFVPHLEGRHLDVLRTRYIHIVTGEGKYENIGESWGLANVLGAKGIPNQVDSWGPDWSHDWVTWRAMMPKYLDEWTK